MSKRALNKMNWLDLYHYLNANQLTIGQITSLLNYDQYQGTIVQIIKHQKNVQPRHLEHWANHSHYEVQRAVAAHPLTPKHCLYRLGMFGGSYMLGKVLDNPNCPSELLEQVVNGPVYEESSKAVSNPNCPRDLVINRFQWFLTNKVYRELHYVTANPVLNKSTLVWMRAHLTDIPEPERAAAERSFDVGAACNPNFPQSWFDRWIEGGDYWLLTNIAKQKGLPEQTYLKLAAHPLDNVQDKLAKNPTMSLKVLWEIAQNTKSAKAREAIAEHPNVDADLLLYLSGDKSITVKKAVAANPKTPEEVWSRFAQMNAPRLWSVLAQNPTVREKSPEFAGELNHKCRKRGVYSNY